LNGILKGLVFLGNKLSYLGLTDLPARSTLADANRNRNCEVFKYLYVLLVAHYKDVLSGSYLTGYIGKEANINNVKLFDSTTFTLFVDVFTGAGRNKLTGKKKGGIKAHVMLSLHSLVPEMVWMSSASKNDKDFLGQLNPKKGEVYIFDKGYVNYTAYDNFTEKEAFYVTRISENAAYKVESEAEIDYLESHTTEVWKDQIISLKVGEKIMKARLVTFKSAIKGKVFRFITNMFEVQATTVAKFYKNRWEIDPFFKQLKQYFELKAFYSDSREGIQTQMVGASSLALIANLIFTVIHRQIKQAEAFTTIVQMARVNLGSFASYIEVLKKRFFRKLNRDIEIIQLNLFQKTEEGVFENLKKQPFNDKKAMVNACF
jgi:Transposase DDE domain